jgi:radical SAM superfamily enzyme YgiQ (UPF0313 family)
MESKNKGFEIFKDFCDKASSAGEVIQIRKPARYIGEEHNIIKKSWTEKRTKVCLCFPDVYEIGMSHLGLKILYHILNKRDDILCERCFAPWHDMEKFLRERKSCLFSLENKVSLSEFDIVGFSLQYELTYTNILNMLDLSGIPLLRKERFRKRYPLIIGGGPCAFNPNPLSEFIDAFLIGDAEEAVLDIADTYKKHPDNKQKLLQELSKVEGVYVPGVFKKSPKAIKKRIIKELRKAGRPPGCRH